jgi:hypothetical protein
MKTRLLTAASAIAVVAVMGSAQAQAYDDVHWGWFDRVSEYSQINFSQLGFFIDPGWTQVERFQVNAGNVYALTDQSNSAAYNGVGGAMPITITVDQSLTQSIDQSATLAAANSSSTSTPGLFGIGYNHGASVDQSIDQSVLAKNGIFAPIYITVDMGDLPYYGSLDATTQLGKIEGSATAMANLASLSSDVGAAFHDTQVAFGTFTPVSPTSYTDLDHYNSALGLMSQAASTGNTGTDALIAAAIEAQMGLITKGNVTAIAKADYVTNLAVQEDATAFGNAHIVNNTPTYAAYPVIYAGLESPSIVNGFVTPSVVNGDLTQFNFNDVTAVASATNLKLINFSNLGSYGAPVSKLTATAMGNLSTVTNQVKLP